MARKNNYDVTRILIENEADLASNTIDRRTSLYTLFNDIIEKILLRDDWVEKIIPDSQGMSITHFFRGAARLPLNYSNEALHMTQPACGLVITSEGLVCISQHREEILAFSNIFCDKPP